ncbi:MAG: ribosome maturation factor RimP [Desulfobacteraceae bacterium]|nr:ribosome maturation factor RimP [Desulfobacteraceae bacterium]
MAKVYKKKRGTRTETPALPEKAVAITDQSEVIPVAWELAEPICNVEGMELIHVEYQQEIGGRVLRLYVDKPGGVTLGDCSLISSQLGDILDLKLGTDDSYTLEISSPGIDRPLSKLPDFEKFKGQLAKIKIARPINGQKKFKGILSGIIASSVQLKTEQDTVSIPYQDIIKARLVNYDGDNKCL